MDTKKLLFELSSAAGAAGLSDAPEVAERALSPFAKITKDASGGLIAVINPNADYTIMLDAHIDEIGMIVTAIDDSGFLRVAKCGGIDVRTLAAQEVVVHAKQPLYGVFCSIPPHLKKDGDKTAPELDDMSIDIGLNAESARKTVHHGDIVTFRQSPVSLQNGLVTGKSLDNRAGVAAIIRAAELCCENGMPDCRLVLSLSSQEELGCRGAKTAAFAYTPDEAVAVDVSFGNSPDIPKHKCGMLSKGPMIGISPTLSRQISEKLKTTAEQKNIEYQIEVMGGSTSTNADVISATKSGIACGLVSIPLRNMHTATEVIDMQDLENTARLLAEYVKSGGLRHA